MKKILLALLLFGGVSSQVAFCEPFVARWARLAGNSFCYLVQGNPGKTFEKPAKKKMPYPPRTPRALLVRMLRERERLTPPVPDSISSICPVPLN